MAGTPLSAFSTSLALTSGSVGHVSDVNDTSMEEEMPAFFDVVYATGKDFRLAVEASEMNQGELIIAWELHGGNKCCIKCKQCDFLVFAKKKASKRITGYVAQANDTIKHKGVVIKQKFRHSGHCRLCPNGGGRGKVRRVSQNRDVIHNLRTHYLEKTKTRQLWL
jgi:hypothetical protein